MTVTDRFDEVILSEIAAIQADATASMTAAAVRSLVRTRVFDAIGDTPEPVDVVATRAGVDVGALRRVLRFIEPQGYVSFEGESVAGTARARAYRSDSPLWPSLAHLGSFDVAHALDHCLQTGEPAWARLHGAPFFDWLNAHPEQERIFAESMRNEGVILNLTAVPEIDLSDAETVADIGGGTGDFISALLVANPSVRGILVDLPSVLENATVDTARCTLYPGDIFGVMPAAGAYVLARVLHDWSDDDCIRILRGIRRSAPEGARLFDLDLVVPQGAGLHPSKLSDIGMMLLFGGGRERTLDEFRSLFTSTGWRLDRVIDLPVSSLLTATAV